MSDAMAELATQTKAVQDCLDSMIQQYDARVLASCFLARAAGLLNALRQMKIYSDEDITQMFIIAIEVADDDTQPVPRRETSPAGNKRMH